MIHNPNGAHMGTSVLSKPLATIFNRSLIHGYFPSNWKDANNTAIHKKKINWFLQIIDLYPYLANWGKSWKGVCTHIFQLH